MGDEDYFVWHERMERRRQENERRMQASGSNVNITRDDPRRSLHQLVKRSRTNAPDGICLMQYELDWDLKHQTLNNYIQMALSTTKAGAGRNTTDASPAQLYQQLITLDIGNDALISRYFRPSYMENEMLRDFMKRQMGYSPFTLENPRRLLSRFNGATTTSLGDVVLLVQVDPIILSVWVLVVDDLSPYNDIIGRVELESGHPTSKEIHLRLIRSNHCPSHTT
ncbi:hypothetical protein AAG906_019471 [Vitis piasezkii]